MKTRRFSQYFSSLFLFMDLGFLNIGFFIANYVRFGQFWFQEDRYPFLYIFLNVAWIAIYFLTRINKIDRELSIIDYTSQVLLALTINIAVVFTMWASTRAYFYSREHLFYTYLIFSITIVSWRIGFIYLIRYYRTKGYNIRRVVIVGYGNIGKNLAAQFNDDAWLGYQMMGFFDHNSRNQDVIGDLSKLNQYVISENIDIIFCCLPKLYDDDVKSIINFAENNLIGVKILSDFSSISNKSLSIQQYGKIPVINVSSIPLDRRFNRVLKRTFDIVFSSLVMIFILSWLVPLIGLLIKLESNGPVFFKQDRHGRSNNSFLCWKFRTMVVNNEADSKQATKNDPRITKLGAFMRKTSIDELPQFVNVFLGNMSVVGPRPHPLKLNEEFLPKIDRFIQRHAVKPGVTGLAQAKGYRGENSKFSEMYGRVKLDRFYVKNWSFILDIKIIFLTIVSMLWKNDKAY